MPKALIGAVAGLLLAPAAHAATVTMVFSGTVSSGFDVTGVFGASNANLAGKAFEAVVQWNEGIRRGQVGSQDNWLYAGGLSNTALVTIDGRSMEFGDRYDADLYSSPGGVYGIMIDKVPHPYDFDGTTYNYFVAQRVFGLDFSAPQAPWYLTTSYDLDGVGAAGFELYAYDKPSKTLLWDSRASLAFKHMKITCEGDCSAPVKFVPEPSTWALMLVGFGGAGAMLRRQRRAPHRELTS